MSTAHNRSKIDVVDAVASAIRKDRVGIRLSPFSTYGDAVALDHVPLGIYLAEQLSDLYIHFVEPRANGNEDRESKETLEPLRKAFKGNFMAAGGFSREDGNSAIEKGEADLVCCGRHFLANPDLPRRFELNAPLNKYDMDTFYIPDPVELFGYALTEDRDTFQGNLLSYSDEFQQTVVRNGEVVSSWKSGASFSALVMEENTIAESHSESHGKLRQAIKNVSKINENHSFQGLSSAIILPDRTALTAIYLVK